MVRQDLGNKRIDTVRVHLVDRQSASFRHGVSRLLRAEQLCGISTVRGKLRQRTVSLYRSMYYGLFSPGTI